MVIKAKLSYARFNLFYEEPFKLVLVLYKLYEIFLLREPNANNDRLFSNPGLYNVIPT